MSADTKRVSDAPRTLAELAERLLVAIERDTAAGIRCRTEEELAGDFYRALRRWIAGELTQDTYRLVNTLATSLNEPTPWEEYERRAARQWLSIGAQVTIVAESLRSGCREVSYVLSRGQDGRFTDARVCIRGNAKATHILGVDMAPGDLVLHTHPESLEPSDADLAAVALLAPASPTIGFGIVSLDGSRLYLMREPKPVPAEAAP